MSPTSATFSAFESSFLAEGFALYCKQDIENMVKLWPWFTKKKLHLTEKWFYLEIDLRAVNLNLVNESTVKVPRFVTLLRTQLKKSGLIDLSELTQHAQEEHHDAARFLQHYADKMHPNQLKIEMHSETPQSINMIFSPLLLGKINKNAFGILSVYLLDQLLVSSATTDTVFEKILTLYTNRLDFYPYGYPEKIHQSPSRKKMLFLLTSQETLDLELPKVKEPDQLIRTFAYIDLSKTLAQKKILMSFQLYREKLTEYHDHIRQTICHYVLHYNLAQEKYVKQLTDALIEIEQNFLDELESNSLNATHLEAEKEAWTQLQAAMNGLHHEVFFDQYMGFIGKYAAIYTKRISSDPAYQNAYKHWSVFTESMHCLYTFSSQVLNQHHVNDVYLEDAINAYKKSIKKNQSIDSLQKSYATNKEAVFCYFYHPKLTKTLQKGIELKQKRDIAQTQYFVFKKQYEGLQDKLTHDFIALENAILSAQKQTENHSDTVSCVPFYQAQIQVQTQGITFFNKGLTQKDNPSIEEVEGLKNYFIYNQAQWINTLSSQGKFYLARKHIVGEYGLGLKYLGDMDLETTCCVNGLEYKIRIAYELKIRGKERLLYAEKSADVGNTQLLFPLIYQDIHTNEDKTSLQTSLKSKIFYLYTVDNALSFTSPRATSDASHCLYK